MTWLNSGIRAFLMAQGTAARWLRDELDSLKVSCRLTAGCIEELTREADLAARRVTAAGDGASYAQVLRAQLSVQANWVHRWTMTDDKAPVDDPIAQAFVRIARKYALPRPWKLSEPVAVEVTRLRPSWAWGRGCQPQAASH